MTPYLYTHIGNLWPTGPYTGAPVYRSSQSLSTAVSSTVVSSSSCSTSAAKSSRVGRGSSRRGSGVFDFEALKKGKNYAHPPSLRVGSHAAARIIPVVLILYALVFRFYCFSSNIYRRQRFSNSLYSVNTYHFAPFLKKDLLFIYF